MDPVLQTRARLCEGKVNGPRDTFVSEMLERLPLANVFEVAKRLSRKIHGKSGGSIFLENCGVPECGKGERARRVAHGSFLPAVVSARGAERALQQWPHVLLSPQLKPLRVGCWVGNKK